MPVIGIQTDLLLERLGMELEREALLEHLYHLGCDVEGFATLRRFHCQRCGNITEITETQEAPLLCERCGVDFHEQPELQLEAGEVDVLRMELLAVRPDMFDPGGLARVLRSYLDESVPSPSYATAPPALRVEVDPAMATDACPRPAIACAVVRDLELSEDLVKVVMKLQENLHWALARDRKHASIGVYDLDTIETARPLRYWAVGPEELRFVPLGYQPEDPASQVTPRQVLEEHPKGRAYAFLLEGWPRYPLLQDAEGRVLSMPPIINSEDTRVELRTRNFFIDVTGTGRRIVSKTLNVLVTSLLELCPSARLEQVTMAYAGEELVTPDLRPQQATLDPVATTRLLGIELDREGVAACLRRMGHQVSDGPDGLLALAIPAYRNDILHARDLMEDVAIAYGYHNIVPSLVPTLTVGRALPVELQSDFARQALTGMGMQEVMTLQLTSPKTAFSAMGLPPRDDCAVIENPIAEGETMVRVSLLPGLLKTLQINTHRELPQRIFEVGDITLLDPEAQTGTCEKRLVAGALTASTAGFADLRPSVQSLLAELGWQLRTPAASWGSCLPGRAAEIVALRGEERRVVGRMGEVHPQVLEAFRLRHPTVMFELELMRLS